MNSTTRSMIAALIAVGSIAAHRALRGAYRSDEGVSPSARRRADMWGRR